MNPKSIIRTTGALAALPENFHGLDGAKKVNAILDLPDPEGFVQKLAADSFYRLVRHIGGIDGTDLLALSTLEQRQTLVDIDCWDGDAVDPDALDAVFDLLGEASRDLLLETVAGLDPELLVGYVLERVHLVLDRSEEDEVEQYQEMFDLLWTPDRDFALVLHKEEMSEDGDDSASRLSRLLEILYENDWEGARSLLFAAKSGLRIEQQELALRFRTARMADLGFMPPWEARELYAPIRIDAVRAEFEEQKHFGAGEESGRLHWALAHMRSHESFLGECLERLDDPTRFAEEFAMCVNRAAAASPSGVDMGDIDRIGEIAGRVHDTISLGLEHLADRDPVRGAEILGRAWTMQLFQVGHTLCVQRAIRARQLRKRGGGLFDEPLELTIEALQRLPQPLYTDDTGYGTRTFRTMADLSHADARLEAGERLCATFEEHFGFSKERFAAHEFDQLSADDKGFVRFDTLARTLVCHLATGRGPSFEPLTIADVAAVRAALGTVGEVAREFARPLGADATAVLVDAATTLASELVGLPEGSEPDPRFFTGLLLVVNQT